MPGFEAWDVVRVPFPHTNPTTVQRRPAPMLAAVAPAGAAPLLWVLMITSAANRGWPGDIDIAARLDAGLSADSIVRTAKIATIDQAAAGKIGIISDYPTRRMVWEQVQTLLLPASAMR